MASMNILVALGTLGALLCVKLFNNWAQLNKVPGPFLAGLSNLWRGWYQHNGRLRQKLIQLHAQHGPVVRYGVRNVSISDPSVIKVYQGRDSFNVVRSPPIATGKPMLIK